MTEAELEEPVAANVSFLDNHDDIADEEAMIDEETDLKPRRTDYSRPQGLLEDLNALVVPLERQRDKAMRRMLGVPSRAKKGRCFAHSQKDRKRSGFSAHQFFDLAAAITRNHPKMCVCRSQSILSLHPTLLSFANHRNPPDSQNSTGQPSRRSCRT